MRSMLMILCALLCGACFDPPPPVIEEPDAAQTPPGDITADLVADVIEDTAPRSLCVTDCNGNGLCDPAIGLCECSPQWTGSDCSQCSPDYYGPDCSSCICIHGTCEDGLDGSGACACEDGWAGAACDISLAIPWSEGPYGSGDGELAGDVTFPTEDGEFSLAAAWSGHDSVLFFFHYPLSPESAALWGDDPQNLLATLPLNVHLVFGSFDQDHQTAVSSMKSRVQSALAFMNATMSKHWEERIHFISEKVGSFSGPLDDRINASSSYKFGIDRYQRWRSLGALYDASVQASSLTYLGHEPWGYNAEQEARQAETTVNGLHLPLFTKEGLPPDGAAQATITLPSETQMEAFDSMMLEIHAHCSDDVEGPSGGCTSLASTVQVALCESADSCTSELARLITPYARSGSWLIDASPLLPLLSAGGQTTFEIRSEQAVWIEASLILHDRGSAERPFAAVPLWNHTEGQAFNTSYCTDQPSVDVSVPEGAIRAELVTRITGHGESATVDMCAAQCSHAHHISVGPTVFSQELIDTSMGNACLDLKGGVTPNQFGLWTEWRAGWCAGSGVQLMRQDVTEALAGGQTVGYTADREGEPYEAFTVDPEGTMPMIRMASWIVFYEARAD